MNRERGLAGPNSYAKELRFDIIDYLGQRLKSQPELAWLDLCCGAGKALLEAAREIERLGHGDKVALLGIDLVDAFLPVPANCGCLRLRSASLHRWKPVATYDLITCVHGLHYVGDKLGLIQRAVSALRPAGRFMAHLDLANLRSDDGRPLGSRVGRWFNAHGLTYDRRRRVLSATGACNMTFPCNYAGADDQAGVNCTGQEAVDSYYRLDATEEIG